MRRRNWVRTLAFIFRFRRDKFPFANYCCLSGVPRKHNGLQKIGFFNFFIVITTSQRFSLSPLFTARQRRRRCLNRATRRVSATGQNFRPRRRYSNPHYKNNDDPVEFLWFTNETTKNIIVRALDPFRSFTTEVRRPDNNIIHGVSVYIASI